MTKEFSRELIEHPYQVSKKKLTNFELLKSLVELMESPHRVINMFNMFNKRPTGSFSSYHMDNDTHRVMNMEFGRGEKYFRTIGLPDNLRESIEGYVGRDLPEHYYLSNYGDFLDIDNLPVVNYTNEKEKLRQFYLSILNQLFKYQEKKFENDIFSVRLDENIIDNYYFFVNNKMYIENLQVKEELFDLINQYFISILHHKDHNFSLEKIFDFTGLKDNVKFDLKTRVLTIDLNLDYDTQLIGGLKTPHYYYKVWFFLGKLIDFLTITELIGIYREFIVLPDITEQQEVFLDFIKDRRISVDLIEHKGAAKKANSLGMTHVFLPLDEEAFPAGIPLSLNVILEKHNKIANIWSVLPPVQGRYVIRNYIGHNNTYPNFTTKGEPHLVGQELMKAQLDDNFYQVLVDNYDWEYRDEAQKTLDLIKEFPRLGNDLKAIAKERTADD